MKNLKLILYYIVLCAFSGTLILTHPYRTCIFPNIFIFGDLHTTSKEEEKSIEDFEKILGLSNSEKLTILVETVNKNLISAIRLTNAIDFVFAQTYITEPPKFITSKYLIQANTELKSKCSKYYFKLNPDKLPKEPKDLNQNSNDLFLFTLGKNNEWSKKFNIIEIDNLRCDFWIINHCLESLQHFCLISLYYPSLLTDTCIKLILKKLNEFCPSFNQLETNINEYKQKLSNLSNKLSNNVEVDQSLTNHINQTSKNLDHRFSDLKLKISDYIHKISDYTNILSLPDTENKITLNWIENPLIDVFGKTFYFFKHVSERIDDYRLIEIFFSILSDTRSLFDNYLNYYDEIDNTKNGFFNEIDNSLDYTALNILIDPKYIDQKFLIFVGNEHLLNLRELLIRIKGLPLLEGFSTCSKGNFLSDNCIEKKVTGSRTNHSKYFPLILKSPEEIAKLALGQSELTKIFQSHSHISGIVQNYVAENITES